MMAIPTRINKCMSIDVLKLLLKLGQLLVSMK